MRDKYSGWFPKAPAEIAELWERAIFVPDANVLLHCLRHPASVREELLRLIALLKESLWIPYQIGLEFHRNRLEVELAAQDAYDTLIGDLDAVFEKARDRLRQLRAHPTISVERELSALEMFLQDFRTRMESAREQHPSRDIEKAVQRLTELLNDRVGEKWKPDQLAAIKKEGEERYAKKIPPGYKDTKKDSTDLGKYGDLIIWKDMIAKASADRRPVIFITDDVKEDWWWINRGRKIGPRPELVEELRAEAGQEFHIYEFGQFLRFAAERFPAMQESVAKVQESVLADEQARLRLQSAQALEADRKVRRLEDERDQIIAILSGAPSGAGAYSGDRGSLRARLEEINGELAQLSELSSDAGRLQS